MRFIGFCPIITQASIRLTIPVAFIMFFLLTNYINFHLWFYYVKRLCFYAGNNFFVFLFQLLKDADVNYVDKSPVLIIHSKTSKKSVQSTPNTFILSHILCTCKHLFFSFCFFLPYIQKICVNLLYSDDCFS